MSKSSLIVKDSKFYGLIWVIPHMIGAYALFELRAFHIGYMLALGIFLILAYQTFQKWAYQYHTNNLIALRQLDFSNPLLWELSFKKGRFQSVELRQYYRTPFMVIFIYKPLHQPRLQSYLLFKHTLSCVHYQQLVKALWSK